jgi:hypothetical protein
MRTELEQQAEDVVLTLFHVNAQFSEEVISS